MDSQPEISISLERIVLGAAALNAIAVALTLPLTPFVIVGLAAIQGTPFTITKTSGSWLGLAVVAASLAANIVMFGFWSARGFLGNKLFRMIVTGCLYAAFSWFGIRHHMWDGYATLIATIGIAIAVVSIRVRHPHDIRI